MEAVKALNEANLSHQKFDAVAAFARAAAKDASGRKGHQQSFEHVRDDRLQDVMSCLIGHAAEDQSLAGVPIIAYGMNRLR